MYSVTPKHLTERSLYCQLKQSRHLNHATHNIYAPCVADQKRSESYMHAYSNKHRQCALALGNLSTAMHDDTDNLCSDQNIKIQYHSKWVQFSLQTESGSDLIVIAVAAFVCFHCYQSHITCFPNLSLILVTQVCLGGGDTTVSKFPLYQTLHDAMTWKISPIFGQEHRSLLFVLV